MPSREKDPDKGEWVFSPPCQVLITHDDRDFNGVGLAAVERGH